jgi:hypothetical protein
MYSRRLAAILPLLFFSCNDGGIAPAPGNLTAVTEQPGYYAGETIRVSFRNSGERTFQLESCCSSFACYIDVSVPGGWKEYEARGIPCLLLCPGIQLLVKPNETTIDSLSINEAGAYRLRIPYTSPDKNETMEVTTNTFTIQSAP